MWFFDFPTLVLVIAAGFQLGVQGLFGLDAGSALFGKHVSMLFMLMGVSAIWQLFRQRFH